MVERPLTEADCEVLHELWNRSAQFDPLSLELLREKIWRDPDYDEQLAIGLWEGKMPVGIATGVVREKEANRVGYVKLLVMDPSYRGKQYGRHLLHTLENRLAEQGSKSVRIGESAPNYLTPGIDVRYTKALLMAEARGYARIGETYNLLVDLSSHEFQTKERIEQLRSEQIEVKRLDNSDSAGLRSFLEAFWPAWVAEVGVAERNDPRSVHVAVKSGEVVGFSAYDANNLGTGWFGPMGTHPDCRGMGIGEVLLKLCLQDIKQQGHQAAIIPWVGPIKFYSRHANARIDRVFYRYEKKLQSR